MRKQNQRAKKQNLESAESILLEVEKPLYGGAFLARLDGKAHFTPLTLPGEEIRARVVESKSSYALCEIEEVLRPSPVRTAPRCRHFGHCGGCAYQHTDAATQIPLKVGILAETLTRAGVAPPGEIDVLVSEPWEYRNRIRLALDSFARLGYRARRSRQIIPISECPIAAPKVFATAKAAEAALRTLPAIGIVEIELFTNADSSELLATLFARTPQREWAKRFAEYLPGITGIQLLRVGNQNAPKGNRNANDSDEVEFSLFDSEIFDQWGANSLNYSVAGFGYRVDNGAFFQVNRFLVDALVEKVVAAASPTAKSLAWDLYAGVGLFARQLAAHFKQVVAVESSPRSKDALGANLAGVNSIADYKRTEDFLQGEVSALKNFSGKSTAGRIPDLIVLDPPRTGLGPASVSLLNTIESPRIVYVSCDPATLARDLKALTAYKLSSLTLADLFPQTFHLESIAVLDRT
jgi:23S rRNA (uracil1939-C5)-methyltransferase